MVFEGLPGTCVRRMALAWAAAPSRPALEPGGVGPGMEGLDEYVFRLYGAFGVKL
jgi:hypothetical protein